MMDIPMLTLGAPIRDIEHVLPHRASMRLVDRVLAWDADSITVTLCVPADGPFHVDGGVPAYVVADDRTLGGIAAARPDSVEALLELPGMGRSRVERYGEDILRIVREAG